MKLFGPIRRTLLVFLALLLCLSPASGVMAMGPAQPQSSSLPPPQHYDGTLRCNTIYFGGTVFRKIRCTYSIDVSISGMRTIVTEILSGPIKVRFYSFSDRSPETIASKACAELKWISSTPASADSNVRVTLSEYNPPEGATSPPTLAADDDVSTDQSFYGAELVETLDLGQCPVEDLPNGGPTGPTA